MAGDWIKMRGNLWDDPRVSKLCDLCDCGEAQVIGALYWLWAAADQHTEDGCMPGLTLRQIDRKTGVPGFGAAMCEVGWLRDDPQGVVIVKFEEHNGTSAKRRCTEAQRKANGRSVSASDADKLRTESGCAADDRRRFAELEKEKEKEKELSEEAKASSSSAGTPTCRPRQAESQVPCPYEKIVEAYHEALPSLPRVRMMDDKRKKAMRQRWGWVFRERREDGRARATNGDEALAWFLAFFERASHNDWLMGRRPSKDYPDFKADFDFLLRDSGWKAVIERTEAAA